jgi:hypothetical protein
MRRILTLLAAASLAYGAAGQELQTRIFQLNNRPAEATVEMVRPLLSPAGTVFPEPRLQKLIVRDTPQTLAEVEKLLSEIDLPAPQVRITVSMSGVAPSQDSLLAAGVRGDLRHPTVELAAQAGSSSSSVQSEQNLLVMNGERGVIHMARDLLSVDPYLQYAVAQGLLAPTAAMQSVSTGFAVEPLVVGQVVRLTVTPWLSFVGPGGRAEVLVDQASTTVALKSGQQATISSGSSRQQESSRAFGLIFASAGGSSERGASIRVRPEIIEDGAGAPGAP